MSDDILIINNPEPVIITVNPSEVIVAEVNPPLIYNAIVPPEVETVVEIVPGSNGVSNLDELNDVDLATTPADGESLTFDAATTKWKPGTSSTALAELTDVDLTEAPTDGQALLFDAATAEWTAETLASTLAQLLDVDLTTSPADGDALVFDLATEKWGPGAVTSSLAGLTDVDTTPAPEQGDLLAYNESDDKWRPATPPASPILLLETEGDIPLDTAPGTIVFRKAVVDLVYDFTDGALPPNWVKHGTASATFGPGGMAATFSAGGGWHIPVAPSGDFIVEMGLAVLGGTGFMFGPTITTVGGAGGGASWYNAPQGCLAISLNNWSYASAFANGGGTPAPGRLRVRKSGQTYYAAYSFDGGESWLESGGVGVSGAPNTVGINCAFSSGTATVTDVVVSTTTNIGRPIGWWDGANIQPLA